MFDGAEEFSHGPVESFAKPSALQVGDGFAFFGVEDDRLFAEGWPFAAEGAFGADQRRRVTLALRAIAVEGEFRLPASARFHTPLDLDCELGCDFVEEVFQS